MQHILVKIRKTTKKNLTAVCIVPEDLDDPNVEIRSRKSVKNSQNLKKMSK